MNIFKNNLLSKKFASLILFVFAYFILSGNSLVNFFSNPCICTSEQLTQELKEKAFDMSWHFTQDSYFQCVCKESEVYLEVRLGASSDTYKDFFSQWKDKFIEREIEGSKQFTFSYRLINNEVEEINILQNYEKKAHPDGDSYIVENRRIVENATPKSITQSQLENIIKNNNILFYTGAGLSMEAGIPDMNELMELLGLEEGDKFLHFLEAVLNNPREGASKISAFYKACFYSTPTKAHSALKDLAVFKNRQIITENFDNLHELSGIYPYRIDPKHLREEVGVKALDKIDYIICVGLSFDDRGFLGWYKQNNPNGKIIAVDLQQPSYLGDEDFLLVGNLQEIIPAIQKNIMQ